MKSKWHRIIRCRVFCQIKNITGRSRFNVAKARALRQSRRRLRAVDSQGLGAPILAIGFSRRSRRWTKNFPGWLMSKRGKDQ